MMKRELGVVIGARRLRGEGPKPKAVLVRVGKPRRSKGPDWECPFSINGLGIRGIQCAHGIDAIQALTMALEGIRVLLERSGARLSWVGGDLGDAGFERFVPNLFGREFSRRLNGMIDQEVERFARAIEKKHQKRSNARRSLPRAAPGRPSLRN
jgi:uncharacterized protein DUF6968